MFSVLIEIAEAALQSYKISPSRLPEFPMFCENLACMFACSI